MTKACILKEKGDERVVQRRETNGVVQQACSASLHWQGRTGSEHDMRCSTCYECMRGLRAGRGLGYVIELLLQLQHDARHAETAVEEVRVVINFHPLELRSSRSHHAPQSLA